MQKKSNKKDITFRIIFSLILALILWFYINGNNSNLIRRVITSVPVHLMNEDVLNQKGLIIPDDIAYFVNLEIRGTEENLNLIQTQQISAEVNLANVNNAGRQTIPVIIEGLSNRVILDQTIPEGLELDVQEITNTEFEPKIVSQGIPANNLNVISLNPDQKIKITGPSEEISNISQVSGTVNVEGISEDSRQFTQVFAFDKEGNKLEDIVCEPSMVNVNIILGQTKEVNVVAPEVKGATAENYKITSIDINPNKVTIAGKPDQLNEINEISPQPINLDEDNNDQTFQIDDPLIVPEGVILFETDNDVKVTVNIEQIIERFYQVSNLKEENLNPSLELQRVSPGSVTVQVRGTTSELNKIDSSKLVGTFNLEGLGVGDHQVKVNVSVNSGNIVSVDPANISVSLTDEK